MLRVTRAALPILATSISLALGAGFTGECDGVPQDQIGAYIEAERQLNSIPGLAVTIVSSGGICSAAFGVKDVASGTAMAVDTPSDLASVSKSFTAAAVWQLWKQGKLNLDAPASRYLAELRESGLAPVTIRQFLRHRSGLPRTGNFLAPYSGASREPELKTALVKLHEAQIRWTPGTMFRYANSNYVVLAALVERVSGEAFASYLRMRLLEPIGMKRTTIVYREALAWGLARPHEWQWGRVRPSPPRFFGWYGASLVKATAEDMGRYVQAWLGHLPQARGAVPEPGWWTQDEPTGYEWGWFIRKRAEGLGNKVVVEHSGDIWGNNAAVILAPEIGTGAAVLINMGAERALDIARGVLAVTAGMRGEAPRAAPLMGRPDFWAMVFVGASAAMLAAVAFLTAMVVRQIRRGARTLRREPLRIIRAAMLASLALVLVYMLLSDFTPPLAVFPATIQIALPLLVVAVAAVLVCAATTGIFARNS